MLMKSPTVPGADDNNGGDKNNSTFVCDAFMYSGQVRKTIIVFY